MPIVKFAYLCDQCGTRSQEYAMWPFCRECGNGVCDDCAANGTHTEPDVDQPVTCVCADCLNIQIHREEQEKYGYFF